MPARCKYAGDQDKYTPVQAVRRPPSSGEPNTQPVREGGRTIIKTPRSRRKTTECPAHQTIKTAQRSTQTTVKATAKATMATIKATIAQINSEYTDRLSAPGLETAMTG